MSAKNVIFGCRAIFGYICSKKGVEEHRFSNDLKIPRRGRENYKLCQIRLLKIIR